MIAAPALRPTRTRYGFFCLSILLRSSLISIGFACQWPRRSCKPTWGSHRSSLRGCSPSSMLHTECLRYPRPGSATDGASADAAPDRRLLVSVHDLDRYGSQSGTLLITRTVFGAAEAGAFPTLSRALSRWFPLHERSRANGIMWMGARSGGALAPPIAVALMIAIGWRYTFAVFGAVGLIWCVVCALWYRDDPADHPSVNAEELRMIRMEPRRLRRQGARCRGSACCSIRR